MVIDRLENLPKYFSLHPGLEEVFTFLKVFAEKPGPARRYELGNGGLFVNAERYITRPSAEREAEAHRNYVDLQLVISGQEQIGIAPLETMTPCGDFDVERDIGFYTGEYTQWARLTAGTFALIWPHEAHLPGVQLDGACDVIKTVAKLPI